VQVQEHDCADHRESDSRRMAEENPGDDSADEGAAPSQQYRRPDRHWIWTWQRETRECTHDQPGENDDEDKSKHDTYTVAPHTDTLPATANASAWSGSASSQLKDPLAGAGPRRAHSCRSVRVDVSMLKPCAGSPSTREAGRVYGQPTAGKKCIRRWHRGDGLPDLVRGGSRLARPFPPAWREKNRMVGVYAGIGFSAILAFLFARLDKRR
jgi:hypothetical protein